MTARVQVLNVFDIQRFLVTASNAFTMGDTRRVTFQLVADFCVAPTRCKNTP